MGTRVHLVRGAARTRHSRLAPGQAARASALHECVAALTLSVVALTAPSVIRAEAGPARPVRAVTRDESLEAAIAGNDIVCLARVLRVSRLAPGDTTGRRERLQHLASIEPVEWVKGALDFQDSLPVYLPNDGGSTAGTLRSIAASHGDGAILFFHDAGGYWLVDETRGNGPGCGGHVGVWRVPAGRGAAELADMRARADGVSLVGLARRADLVVLADCRTDPGGAGGRGALLTVTESLKGTAPPAPLRVAQGCTRLAGHQLLFLRRLAGGAYEPIPFALPTRSRKDPGIHDVTPAEVDQVRESLRDLEGGE